jgi:hypothetical protein
MKILLIGCGLLVLLGTGCVSKSKANAQARAAYLAGKQQGMAIKAQGPAVWFVGNVRQPLVPWTNGLTLAQALLTANYQGQSDPGQIMVYREGQPPINVSPKELLQGSDLPLEAGDRVEIRP